jgi:hypothetical protein
MILSIRQMIYVQPSQSRTAPPHPVILSRSEESLNVSIAQSRTAPLPPAEPAALEMVSLRSKLDRYGRSLSQEPICEARQKQKHPMIPCGSYGSYACSLMMCPSATSKMKTRGKFRFISCFRTWCIVKITIYHSHSSNKRRSVPYSQTLSVVSSGLWQKGRCHRGRQQPPCIEGAVSKVNERLA